MPDYRIVFARSARKELESVPRDMAVRILGKVAALLSDPRPSGCKKLMGHSSLYRIRIGNYRVVYSIDDYNNIIDITVIRHRSDAYR